LWQTYYEQRLASYEHEQCQRSQRELRHAIELLSERRQQQIRQSSAEHCLRADHESLCECASHPQSAPLPAQSGRREELLRALHANDEETRQLTAQISEQQDLEKAWAARLAQIRATLPAERDESGLQLALAKLRQQLADVERSLGNWDHWNATNSRIQSLERELTALNQAPPGVWHVASNHLHELTEGRLIRVGASPHGEVWVESSAGQRFRPHELSNAASHQVALALSAGLAEACERHGVRLPLAIDGFPEFSNEASAENFFRWLARIGRNRQVICCTADEWLAHAARELCIVNPVHAEQPSVRPNLVSGYEYAPLHASTSSYSPSPSARFIAGDAPTGWEAADPIEHLDILTSSQISALRGLGIYLVGDFLAAEAGELSHRLPGIGLSRSDWEWRQSRCRRQLRGRGYDRDSQFRDEAARRERPLHLHQESWPQQRRHSSERSDSARRDDHHPVREQASREHSVREFSDHDRRAAASHPEPQYLLHRKDPVVDAPTIGPSLAKKLESFGIHTVDDLLRASADSVAAQLNMARVSRDTVEQWQHQAALCCDIAALRGQDAQLLVSAEITSAAQMAQHTADSLHQKLADFANTKAGKRWLRGAAAPTLDEITAWIASAKSPRLTQAA
jgi:predicted flap endonuclease-1-like 5' DNA nuclease